MWLLFGRFHFMGQACNLLLKTCLGSHNPPFVIVFWRKWGLDLIWNLLYYSFLDFVLCSLVYRRGKSKLMGSWIKKDKSLSRGGWLPLWPDLKLITILVLKRNFQVVVKLKGRGREGDGGRDGGKDEEGGWKIGRQVCGVMGFCLWKHRLTCGRGFGLVVWPYFLGLADLVLTWRIAIRLFNFWMVRGW